MRQGRHRSAYRISFLFWMICFIFSFIIFLNISSLKAFITFVSFPIACLFFSLNIASFLLFGLDKIQAISCDWRVPEKILYLVTFLGGSIGSLAGMFLFRHKTRKISFQAIIALVVLVQIFIGYEILKFF